MLKVRRPRWNTVQILKICQTSGPDVMSSRTFNLPIRKTAIKRFSKKDFTPLCCNATEWGPFSSIQPFGHIDFDIRSLHLMQVTDLGRLFLTNLTNDLLNHLLSRPVYFFYWILSFSSLRTKVFHSKSSKYWCQSVIVFHKFSVVHIYQGAMYHLTQF